MFMENCSGFKINKIISEMQNGKSSDIPISVIKKTSNIISPILAHHFNYLMGTGIKLGKITPIFKKEDEQLLKNFRQYQHFLSLVKFLRKLFTESFITVLFPKAFCMINNSVFERVTPQIMHLITQ